MLRSWAVPKGMPTAAGEQAGGAGADHELDHLDYTDADKDIADTGWWEEHSRNHRRIVSPCTGGTAPAAMR